MKIRHATEEELPDNMYHSDNLALDHNNTCYKHSDIPKQIDVPIYISYKLSNGYIKARDFAYLGSGQDTELNLAKLIVTIDVPAIKYDDCVEKMVESLKAEKEKIKAETFQKINDIDGQIQQLLAITYTEDDDANTI